MFCRFCGKEILDDSKFCQFCGSPVNEIGDTIEVTPQQTQSINCIVSNTPSEPLRIELIKTKIKKPKFNIKFFWDKYKSIIAKEIVCNAKLLCVAVVFILIYLIGFTTYHRRDIQEVYYTPLNESRYDKKIPERYKYKDVYSIFGNKRCVDEDYVYEQRRSYFRKDLSKNAYHVSWMSVVVLILGRYLILIIKHYIIPFIKWIITNSKSNK